jgi:type II secretory pathway pseudopilin PulG
MSQFDAKSKTHQKRGFTVIEAVVGIAIISLFAYSLFGAFSGVYRAIRLSRIVTAASALANERFEIARNLPYTDVGEVGGLPAGKLAHVANVTRSGIPFIVTTTVRNVDDPFDGTIGGTPNDLSPADYKIVELDITCAGSCPGFAPLKFTGRVAPKNLESASTNGALFLKVDDATGLAVPGASVHIVNASSTPTVVIDDVTDNNGNLNIIDAVPGTYTWNVTATKAGYSTDQTYAYHSTVWNPVKKNATVAIQTVTQLTMTIDKVAALNISTVTATCAPVANVAFNVAKATLIGTSPNQLKYSYNFATDSGGLLNLPNLEYDNYNVTFQDMTRQLAGTVPLSPLYLAPGSSQNFMLIVSSKTPNALLVTVSDSKTGLPITNASVRLYKTGYDNTLITDRGFLTQTDWSGASGQVDFSDATRYFSSDAGIDTHSPAGDVKLALSAGKYATSGTLTSSSFDTGSASNFYQFQWLPTSQPAPTGTNSVRMQIATNSDDATWLFRGPDGTPWSYYTATNTNISSVHNGDRYLRYRMSLTTASTSSTPDVSDTSFTFTSTCTPPGQVTFGSLATGTYTLVVSHTGYQTSTTSNVNPSAAWQSLNVPLTPS